MEAAVKGTTGEMRLVGGSGRLPIIREIVTASMEAHNVPLERGVPDGFRSGDTRVAWDTGNVDDVEAAKDTFDKLVKKGYKAYSVDTTGKKTGTPLDKFDPSIGAIIMVPQMSGGDDLFPIEANRHIHEMAVVCLERQMTHSGAVELIVGQISNDDKAAIVRWSIAGLVANAAESPDLATP